MSSARRHQKIGTSLVLLLTLGGCTDPSNSPDSTGKDRQSEHASTLFFNSAKQTLEHTYKAKQQPGCPVFPDDTIAIMFGPQFTVEHTTWNTTTSSTLLCTLQGNKSTTNGEHRFSLTLTRSEDASSDTARKGYFLFQGDSMLLRNSKLDLPERYPGYGFATESHSAFWQCGPYRLQVGSSPGYNLPTRIYMNDVLQLIEHQAKDLCGTVAKPSTEVLNAPYKSWAIYDAFGGHSPDRYGLNRPEDMQQGLPRPLTTPPVQPKPDERKQTKTPRIRPTSQGSATP